MKHRILQISLSILVTMSLGHIEANDFDHRRQQTIDQFSQRVPNIGGATNPKYLFWYAQAYLAAGKTNEGLAHIKTALNNLNSNDPPFQLWAAMDTYLRWQHLFDQTLKNTFKNKMVTNQDFDYHNTQNKVLMSASGRYLASETWPNEAFASNYSTQDPTGRQTLLDRMELYVAEGEREHNSPTYYVMHYGSFRSLADLALDSEMKKRAAMTAEWMLAAAAPEWLDGHWAAPAERIYYPIRTQNRYSAGTMLLWLYFDGPDPNQWGAEKSFTIQSAVSSYRMPDIIRHIAQDRSHAYIHRALHNHPLSGVRKFFLTSYINQSYGVYSSFEQYQTWPNWMNQLQRWGVCWKQPSGKCVLYIEDPHDGKKKDVGATKYGQVLQHKNTVIGVYNLPAGEYLKGFVPTGAKAIINNAATSGNIYLHYDSLMIAAHLTRTFLWNGTDESFKKTAEKTGFIVEVSPPSAYPHTNADDRLAAFKGAFELQWSQRYDASGITGTKPTLKYTALDGTVLEAQLHGYNKINTTAVAYDTTTWPLLDNPWMHQDYQGRFLTLNYGDFTRRYDFEQWIIDSSQTMVESQPHKAGIHRFHNTTRSYLYLMDLPVLKEGAGLYSLDGKRVSLKSRAVKRGIYVDIAPSSPTSIPTDRTDR